MKRTWAAVVIVIYILTSVTLTTTDKRVCDVVRTYNNIMEIEDHGEVVKELYFSMDGKEKTAKKVLYDGDTFIGVYE